MPDCRATKGILRELKLHTVCEGARCPNMTECFAAATATVLILGDICTRACTFCSVTKGHPVLPDQDEPRRIKEAVARLDLDYVVITSPTRDDLPDGGAAHFARVVAAVKELPGRTVEVLVPDFCGQRRSLEVLMASGPDVMGHNVETVPSLYASVRVGAVYARSLEVLRRVKEISPAVTTKSGMMLGMGETALEVTAVMRDLRACGVDVFTAGQYLAPSRRHYPVKDYVDPAVFETIRQNGLAMGFREVQSGPYVRSSYRPANRHP